MGDKAFYATVTEELIAGQIREGLWASALADAGGSEAQARLIYRDLRKAQLEATHLSRMTELQAIEVEHHRRVRALEAARQSRMAHIEEEEQRRIRALEAGISRDGSAVSTLGFTAALLGALGVWAALMMRDPWVLIMFVLAGIAGVYALWVSENYKEASRRRLAELRRQ